MKQINEKILDITRAAGKIVLSAPRGCRKELIRQKGGTFNYVTEYDVAVQRFLEKNLSDLFPGTHFLAEEEGEDKRGLEGLTFIIDPIDGTSNFIHGLEPSAISVALFDGAAAEFGAVYLPYTDEMFYAEKGDGAYLDGKQIHVSSLPLEKALSLFGTTPYMRDTMSDAVTELMHELLIRSVDVRRFGAAAADLCYVACGRAASFCEMLLSPWDIAAGALIVSEAGGVVSRFDGGDLTYAGKCSIIAANKEAYGEAYGICKEISRKYNI